MKIYFAGNITPVRERVIYSFQANRLYSFYYHKEEGDFNQEFKWRIEREKEKRDKEKS